MFFYRNCRWLYENPGPQEKTTLSTVNCVKITQMLFKIVNGNFSRILKTGTKVLLFHFLNLNYVYFDMNLCLK